MTKRTSIFMQNIFEDNHIIMSNNTWMPHKRKLEVMW